MLKTAPEKISPKEFIAIVESHNMNDAGFFVALYGLFLVAVKYPWF